MNQGPILVFRVGQLGDTLISIPAIRAIDHRHPGKKKVLLTEKSSQKNLVSVWEVLAPLQIFDEVIFYDSSLRKLQLARQLVAIGLQVRRLAPEYIYNLAPDRTPRQHLRDLAFFKLIAGTSHYVAAPPTVRPKPLAPLPRQPAEWQRLLKLVTEDESSTGAKLPLSEFEAQRAREVLEPLASLKRIVGVGPGSNMPAKTWPKERYLEVGKRLLRSRSDIGLVVLGGKGDVDLGDWLCQRWGLRALNLAGKLRVYESAAVLQRCHVYVGNDTGTMHLAAMSGTPCVAVFSARDYPGIWEPAGQGHTVLRAQVDCEGCMLVECKIKKNECLQKITVDEVIEQVQRCLGCEGPA